MALTLHGPAAGAPDIAEPIFRALPAWFGNEAALQNDLAGISEHPTFTAYRDAQPAGFLCLSDHGLGSCELHLVAVRPELHGHGIGSALLSAAESWLIRRGARFLHVKTLSPSSPDLPYATPRRFYSRRGFEPVSEFPPLWGPDTPCLVMLKHLVPTRA